MFCFVKKFLLKNFFVKKPPAKINISIILQHVYKNYVLDSTDIIMIRLNEVLSLRKIKLKFELKLSNNNLGSNNFWKIFNRKITIFADLSTTSLFSEISLF